jgi:hypothetical protein
MGPTGPAGQGFTIFNTIPASIDDNEALTYLQQLDVSNNNIGQFVLQPDGTLWLYDGTNTMGKVGSIYNLTTIVGPSGPVGPQGMQGSVWFELVLLVLLVHKVLSDLLELDFKFLLLYHLLLLSQDSLTLLNALTITESNIGSFVLQDPGNLWLCERKWKLVFCWKYIRPK